MNKQLIVIREENGKQLVSGRELHEKLEINTPYKKWMGRMLDYGFGENTDFSTVGQKCPIANGGYQERTDHILTIDMAKEICMIQRTELGRKFRKYFIECERQLKEKTARPSYLIEDSIARAKAWIKEEEERRKIEAANKKLLTENTSLKEENTAQAEEIGIYEDYVKDVGLLNVGIIAQNNGITAQKLNKFLNEKHIQYRPVNAKCWHLYKEYEGKGYAKIVIENNGGFAYPVLKWTQNGVKLIEKLLRTELNKIIGRD